MGCGRAVGAGNDAAKPFYDVEESHRSAGRDALVDINRNRCEWHHVENAGHSFQRCLLSSRETAVRKRGPRACHALFDDIKLYKAETFVHDTEDDESAKELSE